ncbi:MAG: hypothetical protein GC200_02115 [Tepidisphaera sp.]|nr:hypothetical protein [Tepidisphaera sp.]
MSNIRTRALPIMLGDELAVPIDERLLAAIGATEDTAFEMRIEGETIILTPQSSPSSNTELPPSAKPKP